MVSNTKEIALELAIERHLTGATSEECKAGTATPDGPWRMGDAADFDAALALDQPLLWEFLHATQPVAMQTLQKRSPGGWQGIIANGIDHRLRKYGLLHLLKKGLRLEDVHLTLMYPAPLASSSERIRQNFAANIWSVTRQVHHSVDYTGRSVDMVLFINGLPMVIVELKNPWTGQTARYHGQKQYRSAMQGSPCFVSGAFWYTWRWTPTRCG